MTPSACKIVIVNDMLNSRYGQCQRLEPGSSKNQARMPQVQRLLGFIPEGKQEMTPCS